MRLPPDACARKSTDAGPATASIAVNTRPARNRGQHELAHRRSASPVELATRERRGCANARKLASYDGTPGRCQRPPPPSPVGSTRRGHRAPANADDRATGGKRVPSVERRRTIEHRRQRRPLAKQIRAATAARDRCATRRATRCRGSATRGRPSAASQSVHSSSGLVESGCAAIAETAKAAQRPRRRRHASPPSGYGAAGMSSAM